jgi:hypothetical protein
MNLHGPAVKFAGNDRVGGRSSPGCRFNLKLLFLLATATSASCPHHVALRLKERSSYARMISIGEKLFALEECTVGSASIQIPALPLAFCSNAGEGDPQKTAGWGEHAQTES